MLSALCNAEAAVKNIFGKQESSCEMVNVYNQQFKDFKTRMLYISEHISNCAPNSIIPLYPFDRRSVFLRNC